MNRTVFLLGFAAATGGFLGQALGAWPKRSKNPAPASLAPERASSEVQAYGRTRVRHFTGDLTLEKAVDLALHQNPDVLSSIQEIERTRGLIIEVRAAALPQLTLSGSYNQQDRRLFAGSGGGLRGGGLTGAQGLNSALLSTAGSSLPGNAVGNTNTTGGNLVTGGTGATGTGGTGGVGLGGLSTARQALSGGRRAVAEPIGGGTTGTPTTSADNTADVLSQLSQFLGNDSTTTIQNKSWNVNIRISQPIYTGGQISAAIRIAKFTQDSAYYQLRDLVDRVISEVRADFYLILLNRSLITVAEEAVRLASQQLQDQRNRFEAGTVPRFNVLRAEVELANVEPNLIKARNDYLLAQIQLSRRLGLDPGPTGKPEFFAVGDLAVTKRKISLIDALALARARRPFLKVQRQLILIDTEQIKVEMAGYKPRLDVNAGYEFRNRQASDELSDVVNGWFFGATGSWDIFDGFATYGRVKQARARLEQSKINYDDAVRQVELEVQTAFANLKQARQTVESQQKNVESAIEAVRLAQERFSAGAGTQLEILDARVALTRARTTELQARSDFNRGLAEFDRATATDTKYNDTFQDPLAKVERGIFARLAQTGLPKFSESHDEPQHRSDPKSRPKP